MALLSISEYVRSLRKQASFQPLQEVGGHFHAPGNFNIWGPLARTHRTEHWTQNTEHPGRCGERKNRLSLLGIEPFVNFYLILA